MKFFIQTFELRPQICKYEIDTDEETIAVLEVAKGSVTPYYCEDVDNNERYLIEITRVNGETRWDRGVPAWLIQKDFVETKFLTLQDSYPGKSDDQ